MNLAIRGIEANLGPNRCRYVPKRFAHGSQGRLHPRKSCLQYERLGRRAPTRRPAMEIRRPFASNANYAWVQHFIHHLAPNGVAGFVLANGSMSSNQSGEGDIRKALVEADLVDCMITLPAQLSMAHQISACLWFIAATSRISNSVIQRTDSVHRHEEARLPRGQDASGTVGRRYRSNRADIRRLAGRKKRGRVVPMCQDFARAYADLAIRSHQYALVPGRYVGFDREARPVWNVSQLREELVEIERRISDADNASSQAIQVLRDVLNG